MLSIDTCDSRGSIALLHDRSVEQLIPHATEDEYSSWLLPNVNQALKWMDLSMKDVDGYAVAAGPGSFTGLRVGLTTVKAWAEVYRRPVVAVSRLEAIAAQADGPGDYVGAFLDARRGQVFGAVYQKEGPALSLVGEEVVMELREFVHTAAKIAGLDGISWVSPDASLLDEAVLEWRKRLGETVDQASSSLAGIIGRIGLLRLQEGKTTDALRLDANYVRRSDAEIFWKGAAHGH
ncbi:MAG TPA: tRNA (adenosine(37)-N6)-threonylcarbamoyltransferase complex dimerization subunit type 1 TsaB [Candidatus Acidoferrum sp.]|nr:tRNA (adenosine(37)-N6)-threonylcarbamoyltransferase complex dimerization subunit type 1 TsaB [Candidatus Acidoferrum sp.]